jgi:hypothetical protein
MALELSVGMFCKRRSYKHSQNDSGFVTFITSWQQAAELGVRIGLDIADKTV